MVFIQEFVKFWLLAMLSLYLKFRENINRVDFVFLCDGYV